MTEWKKLFDHQWKTGQIVGWKPVNRSITKEPQPLRLGMFNDKSELEALGMERLKEALMALELKCGGSIKEKAEVLDSSKALMPGSNVRSTSFFKTALVACAGYEERRISPQATREAQE